MGIPTSRVSATFISSNDNNLIVVGGNTSRSYVTGSNCFLYNFTSNKWTFNLSFCCYARFCAGIGYDKYENKVYLGGGYHWDGYKNSYVDIMEYYDIKKDEWNYLPQTNISHGYYPIIWKNTNNGLLYIASINNKIKKLFIIESLDPRSNDLKWNICDYDFVCNDKFKDLNLKKRLLRFE